MMPRPPFGLGKEQFFKDLGYEIHGTVHVGVNDGTELCWYLKERQLPILGFEPNKEVYLNTCQVFAEEIADGLLRLENIGLGIESSQGVLAIPRRIADGVNITEGGSFLDDLSLSPEEYFIGERLWCQIKRFDEWAEESQIDLSLYDLLVIDVQGMELQVLEGFGGYLDKFSYLVVECSETPIYRGEASAQEICNFLEKKGFQRMTSILSHNDILFLRKK